MITSLDDVKTFNKWSADMGRVQLPINVEISEKDFDKFYLNYTKEEFADIIIRQVSLHKDVMIKGGTIKVRWEDRNE